ncbi:MAG: family 43 glycosylhydrolase [Verrucomicrobiia bacterium]
MNRFIVFFFSVAMLMPLPPAWAAAADDEVLLFSFFRGNGEAGTYLAWSEDGLHFQPLNDDKPIFPPAPWPEQNLTRDPSIIYHDGRFHAVWTTGWKGRVFGYAESADLVHWSEPLKVQSFPDAVPAEDQPRNVWAPEIHWDPAQKNYAILFSTTTDRESRNGDGSNNNGKDGHDHRIYITRTADGKVFSPAKLFFDQHFSVIDAQMAVDGDRWVMALKHEQEIPLGGKNLRLTFAPLDLSKPWSPVSAPVFGPGSPIRPHEKVEGACLVKWKGQWHLYTDAFANGHYSMATSPDLKTWTDRTGELVLPPNNPRHGTIFRALRSAVGFLKPGAASHGKDAIDSATLDRWSAPYRGWHYWPDHVIPARPVIESVSNLLGTDVPTVYQVPGSDKYYMSFIGFDGRGYQSFVAESDDLVHWGNYRLAMGFGPANEFDHGGRVIGAFLYESYDIKTPRLLKKRDGKFWTLYGAYPRQGGYELRPGYEGVAVSDDGLTWRRAKDQPILSVHDSDCAAWEKSCIYQPWLVEHEGKFFDFYNAANGGIEQMGVAFSNDLFNWTRHPGNPIVRNRAGGYDERFSSDGKVFRDGDHWTMFYFGVGRGGAHIMVAFSRDLVNWTAHPEPLYKSGGNPSGLDKQFAHKIGLVYNPKNDTFYMFYNAVPGKKDATGGRGIGLITSKPLAR